MSMPRTKKAPEIVRHQAHLLQESAALQRELCEATFMLRLDFSQCKCAIVRVTVLWGADGGRASRQIRTICPTTWYTYPYALEVRGTVGHIGIFIAAVLQLCETSGCLQGFDHCRDARRVSGSCQDCRSTGRAMRMTTASVTMRRRPQTTTTMLSVWETPRAVMAMSTGICDSGIPALRHKNRWRKTSTGTRCPTCADSCLGPRPVDSDADTVIDCLDGLPRRPSQIDRRRCLRLWRRRTDSDSMCSELSGRLYGDPKRRARALWLRDSKRTLMWMEHRTVWTAALRFPQDRPWCLWLRTSDTDTDSDG